MIFKKRFLWLWIFLLPAAGFSLPEQKPLYPGDWVYEALSALSLEQGRVLFSDSVLTVGQTRSLLAQMDTGDLSPAGMETYRRLEAYLDAPAWLTFDSDVLKAGVDLRLQPEFYFKTGGDSPWIYDYHSRNPPILIPLSLSLGSWLSAGMDFYIGQNEYAAVQHKNYINIPLDPVDQFDIHFPRRAYFNAGLPLGKASGLSFAMGIGDDFFGRTRTGSVILSEYLERVIYAQLSLYSPAIKYTAEVMQYEVNKYQYMHYLQIRPHRIVSLSLAEGVMVNAPLELRFLNPLTIFHSHEAYKTYTDYNRDLGHEKNTGDDPFDPGYDKVYDPTGGSRIGSYFGVKIEIQPLRGLRLYGLFVMDQIQLAVEKSTWEEDLTPDALGFQAGIEVSVPVNRSYWNFGLEGVYTYPYMYVLWDKKWSFYKEMPESDRMTVRYWTGTPFGPDSIAGALWVDYQSFARWSLGLSFVFAARGERSGTDIFDHDSGPDDTYRPSHAVYGLTRPPTGVPVYAYTLSFPGKWAVKSWLDLAFQPGWRMTVNSGHIRGKTAQSFEFALSASFKAGAWN
jgi:hypothetical protein